MKNTSKTVRLVAILSLCFFALEISTTTAMPLNEESIKLDQMGSGQQKNTDKDDDLFGGESDKGSGDSIVLDEPQNPVHSTLLSDKQVDKLIQEEDLGVNGASDIETSGKSPNNVPNFKSSSHSLEEPEIYGPNDNGKKQELNDENSMENEAQIAVDEPEVPANNAANNQSVQIPPHQENKPAVQENAAVADSAPAVQPQVATDTASVATQPQTPLDNTAQQPQLFRDDVAQPGTPFNTDNSQATQPQDADTSVQQTQSFVTDNTAQQDATMNTVPDQSQSFIQQATPVQPEAQPAVSSYSAAAPQPADPLATQQTFNDQAFSTQQSDYQGDAVSAYTAQQPADTTNNAAATQQWDTTVPQETQQYNDAAALSPQAAQIPPAQTTANSYTTEGKSHTIQLNDERYRTLICQNGKETISCPPNKQISIVNANYGSMGASACLGRQSFTPSQMCKTPGAYEIVKSNCDDMENCELMANDDLFGSECSTDKKYLDLEYDCVPSQSPSPYQAGVPQAMYPAQQPAASPYMYPGAQPAASPYQGYPSAQQGYGQEQQQLAPSPPPPKLPELMSRLVALSQKNQASSQQMCSSQCNTCTQCTAMPVCNPCPVCQSSTCTAPSVPYIPKGLRPLWELWNEKTADMNSMEMSALIMSPVPKLPPTKKSSSLTEKSEGSGDENSDKRSHVKSSKKTSKKSVSKHSKATKSDKASKKSSKSGSKAKHS